MAKCRARWAVVAKSTTKKMSRKAECLLHHLALLPPSLLGGDLMVASKPVLLLPLIADHPPFATAIPFLDKILAAR